MKKSAWEFREYEDGNTCAVYSNYRDSNLCLWCNEQEKVIALHWGDTPHSMAGATEDMNNLRDGTVPLTWEEVCRRAEEMADFYLDTRHLDTPPAAREAPRGYRRKN